MNRVTKALNIVICLLVLISSIGIPVVINHIHNPPVASEQIDETQEVFCEEAVMCCSTEEESLPTETLKSCDCNLLASCCCCFLEVELVAFSFDIPLSVPVPTPSFVEAYSTELSCIKNLSGNSTFSIKSFELPPPKPYSQQLSLFQVFRI